MFTESSIRLASIINKELKRKGLQLYLRPGSPLAPILQFVVQPSQHELDVISSNEGYKLGKRIIELTRKISTEDAGTTSVGYDEAMDQAVAEYAPMLSRYITVVRTVINPFVRELGDIIHNKLMSDDIAVEDIDIVESPMPNLLLNTDFTNLIMRYSDRKATDQEIPLYPTLPPLDETQVRGLFNAMDPFADQVGEWLNSVGEGWDMKVYNDIFRHGIRANGPMSSIFSNGDNGLNYAIGSFLVSSALLIDPIEGCGGTLAQYQQGLAMIRDQAAYAIKRYLEGMASETETGTLVKNYNLESIVVNPLVYRKWIKNGGSNKALYGLTLGGHGRGRRITVESIDLDKDKLEDNWNDHVETMRDKARPKYIAKATTLLENVFVDLLPKYSAKGGDELGVDDVTAVRNVKQVIMELGRDQFLADRWDPYAVAAHVICKAKYPDLDCDSYLRNITQATIDNTELSMTEAATVATIDFVAKWVAKDIALESRGIQ